MFVLHENKKIKEFVIDRLNLNTPCFISRLGGSDFEAVCSYINDPNNIHSEEWFNHHLKRTKDLNGYFDFENNKDNFEKYLQTLFDSYQKSEVIAYAGKIGKQFYRTLDSGKFSFKSTVSKVIDQTCRNKTCINWNSFFEEAHPFLSTMQFWAVNKKILIISPFSESIEHQFKFKDKLFHNFTYPEFKLLTYTTKITYSTNEDNKETLDVTTNNWHEECLKMSNEIKKLDFDIALLSCASYSMYLGNYIKNQLSKKAIYIGGPLNLYFNIYGERYKDIYDIVGCNKDYQIEAIENSRIEKIKGGRSYHGESLNAYFGKK